MRALKYTDHGKRYRLRDKYIIILYIVYDFVIRTKTQKQKSKSRGVHAAL